MKITTYPQAQAYLESLTPQKGSSYFHVGLDRIKELLKLLENPHVGQHFIHVGGTAGKGSTATMIAAILQEAGYKTGLHISPHLEDIRERMQINSELMSEAQFAQYTEQVANAVEDMRHHSHLGAPSYFETILAMAFLYFKNEQVDIAVIEVGMGGTHDGTNVIQPLVSVLTNVGLDHMEILGDTVEKIASDKVGIIKEHIPVVSGVTQPSVIKIVREQAEKMQAPLFLLQKAEGEHGFDYVLEAETERGTHFSYFGYNQKIEHIHMELIGEHQVQNASLAIAAVFQLPVNRFVIPKEAIRKALYTVKIPGRFEILRRYPAIILDGAHNPMKMEALAQTLRVVFPNRKMIFIFAAKKGKNVGEMLEIIEPLAKQIYITQFQQTTDFGKDMALSVDEVAGSTKMPLTPVENASEALDIALLQSTLDDVICITGSLYLVGEIRTYFSHQTLNTTE